MLRHFNLTDIDQLRYLGMLILAFTFSISVHEWAHAYSAYRLGDKTAYQAGRMSLNPFVHLDPIGFLLLLVAGVGYAKAVPVNPWNFKERIGYRKGMLMVALAGPFSNVIIALATAFVQVVLNSLLYRFLSNMAPLGISMFVEISTFLDVLIYLNLALAAFNLIPIPPLDGFQILSYFLPDKILREFSRYYQQIRIAFFLIIFLLPGIFSKMMSIIQTPLEQLLGLWFSLLHIIFF